MGVRFSKFLKILELFSLAIFQKEAALRIKYTEGETLEGAR